MKDSSKMETIGKYIRKSKWVTVGLSFLAIILVYVLNLNYETKILWAKIGFAGISSFFIIEFIAALMTKHVEPAAFCEDYDRRYQPIRYWTVTISELVLGLFILICVILTKSLRL